MNILLRREGYETSLAGNGQEALKILDKASPDTILMDIMMPEMDGYEACQAIKADEQLCDIPVLFLTGKSDKEDVVKGLEMGASDYIVKPFNSTEFLLRVKTQVELKKSRDELREKNKELQQLNANKDKFFSIISHDLKSPFQGLLGLTELLKEDIETMSGEDIRQFVTMIHDSAHNLLNLLENLLEWSILESNKKNFKPGSNDLSIIIDKNIQLHSANISRKNITLENRISESVTGWFDYHMIQTVVQNLLSNAIKYTPEGGQITLTGGKEQSQIYLKVSDSGIGMDQETIQSLFQIDKVSSRAGTGNEKGTGLGLIICKELVEKNEGDIKVESVPEKGSVFTVTLPSAQPVFEK